MKHLCKKCLLLEAGETETYYTVRDYISTIDQELKADEDVYKQRLSLCRNCEFLISGMCRKCGCYAEVRAVFKDKQCADYDNRKW